MASVVARKNKSGKITGWKFMVCLGRDKNGKQIWRCENRPRLDGLTPAAERKAIRRQCDDWAAEIKVDWDKEHKKIAKNKITLSAFIDEHWIPDCVMNGRHTVSTIAAYRRQADEIKMYFGDKRLNMLDAESIKRFVNYLTLEARTQAGKPYSPASVQACYKCLRNIVRYALRMGYLKQENDPFKDLTNEDKPKTVASDVDFLSASEARKFLDALKKEPLFWQCYFKILIICGLRRGEAVGLQWRDIDETNRALSIRRNVTMDKDAPDKVHIGAPKTPTSCRTIPITQRLIDDLMAFRREQAGKYGNVLTDESFIFCRADNPDRPLYPSTPTLFLRRFCKRHELRPISPHDLRHSCGTLMVEAGVDVKTISVVLGHADTRTTARFYIGYQKKLARNAVDGLESVLYKNNGD